MNIYDISRQAGVSIATVSRVLNGSGKVSEATREKILSIIKETGYTPNAFARGLGLNTMNTIGILCADSSDPYLALAIYHVEQELRSHGYDSILCCTGYDYQTKVKYLELLLSKRVDAVILAGSTFVEASPAQNRHILDAAKEVPVIIINGYLEGRGIYCSVCDDFDALRAATKRVLDCGRKNPLYLYRALSYSGREKLRGFEAACLDYGLSREAYHTGGVNGSIYDTINFLEELQKQKHFDMILTSDDELAIGALKFARARGLSVPEEMSILGFNNSRFCVCCDPELSSIDCQLSFICANAITLLLKALKGEPAPAKTALSAQIVVRGTTDTAFARACHTA